MTTTVRLSCAAVDARVRQRCSIITRAAVLAVGIAGLFPLDAHAQLAALEDRVSIHVNGAYQARSERLQHTLTFTAYEEQARFLGTAHDIDGGGLFDAGGSLRVWRRLAIGATYSQLSSRDVTGLAGSLPHPLLFDRLRDVGLQTVRLRHRERVTDIQVGWTVPLGDRFDLTLAGGPSVFNVTQGVVTGIDVTEIEPPFTSVDVNGVASRERMVNRVGVNIGADMAYMATARIGVGFFVRYAGASVDLPTAEGRVSLDVGGVRAGGGIRVRF